eukprot:5908913-Prymnesium_polylepis.1
MHPPFLPLTPFSARRDLVSPPTVTHTHARGGARPQSRGAREARTVCPTEAFLHLRYFFAIDQRARSVSGRD